jgi:hypothetical protein
MSTPGSIKRYLNGAWAREGSYVIYAPTVAALPAAPDEDGVFAWVDAVASLYYSDGGAWHAYPAGGAVPAPPTMIVAQQSSISPLTAPVIIATVGPFALAASTLIQVNVNLRVDTLDAAASSWQFRLEGTGIAQVNPAGFVTIQASGASLPYGVQFSHRVQMSAGPSNTVSATAYQRVTGTGTIRTFAGVGTLEVIY